MSEKTATKAHYYRAIGRRKQSVAVVKLMKGRGDITVNEKTVNDYFLGNETYVHNIKAPLELLSKAKEMNVEVKVDGGGLRGQSDAIRLGVARALVEMSEDFRTSLKKHGYLTRDPRKKERKKPGLRKARKSPQFSKR
jgi:small subunit ribosomal protein S9